MTDFSTVTTTGASPAVSFQNVTCRIGARTVLDQIVLTIPSGSITGLLGPNGAGKTTLLDLVSGLRLPSAGEVTVLGERHQERSLALRRRIGVVFQETILHDELTTFENLDFAASLYDLPDPKRQIAEAMELLGLTERAGDRVGRLSGGLRRRATIARALLHSPELLLIDEPTLGVDAETRHAIWSHLRLLRAVGTTVIVSTNYLDEALALCDTVSVLREGKVLITDTPAALVARAGSCLDLDCTEDAGAEISSALAQTPGVLRVSPTATGVAVFLRGDADTENVIRQALNVTAIQGFRSRSADLAEVFHALGEETA